MIQMYDEFGTLFLHELRNVLPILPFTYSFLLDLMNLAGTPATTANGSTSFVTTAPLARADAQ